MGRQLRIEYPGAYSHVTARGNEKKEVFKSERDRIRFLEYLESSVVRYGATIHVEADEYATELSRYIHLTPVRIAAASMPEEFRWSSYQDSIGLRKSPHWLTTQCILGLFGDSEAVAQKKYRVFVDDAVDKEHVSPLKGALAGTILGNVDFVAEIQERQEPWTPFCYGT